MGWATRKGRVCAIDLAGCKGNLTGFAQAMERLLTDDTERERRAKLLKEIADKMDWKVTTSDFLKWFRSH